MTGSSPSRGTRFLALGALLLAILLVAVSGYIRLAKAGFGCEPWPACFGQGALAAPEGPLDLNPFAALLHRVTATILGLLVLAIAWRAFFRGESRAVRIASVLLLVLTVGLAALGPWSATLAWPAVTFTNLVGGVVMVAVLGWLVAAFESAPGPGLRRAVQGGLVLAALQLVLGGLAAAHLAGPACPELPTCRGAWLPGLERLDWASLWRPLQEGARDGVLSGLASGLDQLHRLAGIVVVVYGLVLAGAVARWRAGEGLALLLLVLLPPALGIASVVTELPLALALLHYLSTVALVLGLVRLGGAGQPAVGRQGPTATGGSADG